MAWAEGTGSSGRLTKGLFKPVSEAFLWADFGAVAGEGTTSVCRVGYPKRDTNFGGGRPGRISGSKLLFEVVSKADWPSPNQMA
jgi:hypothetical protein